MSSHKVYLYNPGSIPGFGMFPGNTVVTIDDDTHAILDQSPIFPGVPQEAMPPELTPPPSASAASATSSEADAAVLPDSSPEPGPTPVAQPAQPTIMLPVNGG